MRNTTAEFTMQDALAIQSEHIGKWAKVLNINALDMLVREANKRNKKGYKSPYNVFRGGDIDMFIHNEIITKL
jgi:hypothetical protein